MNLDLDSFFGRCFCLELGGAEEWTSDELVCMMNTIQKVLELLTCL